MLIRYKVSGQIVDVTPEEAAQDLIQLGVAERVTAQYAGTQEIRYTAGTLGGYLVDTGRKS